MPKRATATTRTVTDETMSHATDAGKPADRLEERVVAFAEQLGRIVGTVQAKAEGWMESEALKTQIASVRDGAADLLDHLSGGATEASQKLARVTRMRQDAKGRSGGVVDAPGKKHRRPIPSDPAVHTVVSRSAKMRTAKPMIGANRRRGR
jgi:hypothetical protein